MEEKKKKVATSLVPLYLLIEIDLGELFSREQSLVVCVVPYLNGDGMVYGGTRGPELRLPTIAAPEWSI